MKHPKFTEICNSFQDWATGVSLDLRLLGLVVLQLFSQRPLNPKEEKFLRLWESPPDQLGPFHTSSMMGLSADSRDPADVAAAALKRTERTGGGVGRGTTPPCPTHSNTNRGNSPNTRGNNSSRESRFELGSRDRGDSGNSGTGRVGRGGMAQQLRDGEIESQGSEVSRSVTSSAPSSLMATVGRRIPSPAEVLLSKEFPHIGKLPAELRTLLEMCFAPRHQLVSANELKVHGEICLKLEFALLSSVARLHQTLSNVMNGYHLDAVTPKPTLWTKEDEDKRRKAHQRHEALMQMKAIEGVEKTHKRLLMHQFQTWYDQQSDEYKAKQIHRKRARKISRRHDLERRKFLYIAQLHLWHRKVFQGWVKEAIVCYGEFIIQTRGNVQAKMRKKLKPEVFETRLLNEFLAVFTKGAVPKILSAESFAGADFEEESEGQHSATNSLEGMSSSLYGSSDDDSVESGSITSMGIGASTSGRANTASQKLPLITRNSSIGGGGGDADKRGTAGKGGAGGLPSRRASVADKMGEVAAMVAANAAAATAARKRVPTDKASVVRTREAADAYALHHFGVNRLGESKAFLQEQQQQSSMGKAGRAKGGEITDRAAAAAADGGRSGMAVGKVETQIDSYRQAISVVATHFSRLLMRTIDKPAELCSVS